MLRTSPTRARGGAVLAGTMPIDENTLKKLLGWARGVSRGIARHYHFAPGSQEGQDLDAVAHLTLVRLLPVFDRGRVPDGGDPVGQLQGWAHPHIRGECEREAIRLRNGGTYWTRVETVTDQETGIRTRRVAVAMEGLPLARTGDGEHSTEVLLTARPEQVEEDDTPRPKRRWDTSTGEEVANPAPPRLSYQPGVPPGFRMEWLELIREFEDIDKSLRRLARFG